MNAVMAEIMTETQTKRAMGIEEPSKKCRNIQYDYLAFIYTCCTLGSSST